MKETLTHLEYFAKDGKWKLFRILFPFGMLFLNIKIVTQMHVTDTRPISGQGELIPLFA